jgi:hypothetical protein
MPVQLNKQDVMWSSGTGILRKKAKRQQQATEASKHY